ncbi:MAG: hypothetical protein QOH29_502 [Actinomycetota bacterium]|nr:hypothetical protein [Actinomycetota bacterium]
MRTVRIGIAMVSAIGLVGVAQVHSAASATPSHSRQGEGQWVLSRGAWTASRDATIGLKLDAHRVMWLGGLGTSDPVDILRTSIYDIRTQQFQETAPVPAAKTATNGAPGALPLAFAGAGVLADGSVVLAGGEVSPDDPVETAASRLTYRYDPRSDRWTRTGDLPVPQEWVGTPSVLLRDGRLLMVAGRGVDEKAVNDTSRDAFVYNPRRWSTVDVVDPATGTPTGERARVRGRWDFTRTQDGSLSQLSEGHYFGSAVQLRDGRVLVTGGHTHWNNDVSVLSTHTDFFAPTTGVWTQGPSLPTVPAEDGALTNSHGGRTNGVCVAALADGKVVIAGGGTQDDGTPYFTTLATRQSILVLTPAREPRRSHFELAPTKIPSGQGSGAYFGDDGRNNLLCYAISRHQVMIAGGQNNAGEDLFDGYIFDTRASGVRRGPDLVHAVAPWAGDPAFGYPAGFQAPEISTREVSMRDSLLVFPHNVLVSGGGYANFAPALAGSPHVEQLTCAGTDT